ncbi:D-tagatose 3-epimerase [Caulifigura coniformis]|uniref:D-tagatose 3-epimerase n=1 Tax=Caulifigura coniformis TaxID=2527983 RepID=A0A517SIC9_9PLAN|nr:sugar phosphate isomerase/epimerase family protein [Caulifigura coniformis]QDT55884.1 D-tagatose 3-epimerase [Caulifigura coniformis]
MKIAYTLTPPGPAAHKVLAWAAPLNEGLPRLADMGYDGVELMPELLTPADADNVRRLAELSRISIAAIGTGLVAMSHGLSLSAEDETARRAAVKSAEACLEFCRIVGASMLTIGAFRGRCEPSQVDTAKGRFADSLSRLADGARRRGVTICIEPQNRFQSSFFRTVAETMPLLDAIGGDAVGLSLDTFHMNIEEAGIDDACRAGKGRVRYVQLADNHRGVPGRGMFPFNQFRQSLAAIGYDGWMSLELAQGPVPETTASMAMSAYREMFPTRALT